MHGNLDTQAAQLHAYYLEQKSNLITWSSPTLTADEASIS